MEIIEIDLFSFARQCLANLIKLKNASGYCSSVSFLLHLFLICIMIRAVLKIKVLVERSLP